MCAVVPTLLVDEWRVVFVDRRLLRARDRSPVGHVVDCSFCSKNAFQRASQVLDISKSDAASLSADRKFPKGVKIEDSKSQNRVNRGAC